MCRFALLFSVECGNLTLTLNCGHGLKPSAGRMSCVILREHLSEHRQLVANKHMSVCTHTYRAVTVYLPKIR